MDSQIEKLKKDTSKEMENNERLTSVQTRLENDVSSNLAAILDEKNRIDDVEIELMNMSKLLEQSQNELDTASWVIIHILVRQIIWNNR